MSNDPVSRSIEQFNEDVERGLANSTVGQSTSQPQPEAVPDAWLYTFRRPGKWTVYASVDVNERRDEITDAEWVNRQMTPLTAAKGAK